MFDAVKYVKLTLVALFSSCAAMFAACAGGNDVNQGTGALGTGSSTTAGGGNNASGNTTSSSSTSSTSNGTTTGNGGGNASSTSSGTVTSSGAGCIGTCNIDSDCQNTCNPPSTGIYCCDTMNSMCFLQAQSPCADSTSSSSSSGNTGT